MVLKGVAAIVALLLLHTCVFSCLTCGQWRCVFRHAEVSSRGKERETYSQKVTSARPYAFGWAWGRLERSYAMMRSFKGIETVPRWGAFICFARYTGATVPNVVCVVRTMR